jgi:nucleotide-binding universal stress UspA family protein
MLVVLENDESDEQLLEEAQDCARGRDAVIHPLSLVTADEWESDQRVLETIATEENTSLDSQDPDAYAEATARRVAADVLDEDAVSVDPLGAYVGDRDMAEAILEVAADNDTDHVFIGGRTRSPAGKAIFGDTTQAVVLNFDGYVTVRTAR